MKLFNFLLNIYINSSLHVALAVCALVGVTCFEFDISISKSLIAFVFFGTVVGYNFVRYASVYKTHFKKLNIHFLTIQIVSLVALVYYLLQLSSNTLMIAVLLAFFTFLYANPLNENKNLRNFTGLKISIVALVWTGSTVILPIINNDIEMLSDVDVWLTFFQRLLFVFALTLPFEIRDLNFDDLTLETLPQRIGIFKTKLTGMVMLFIVILLELFKDEIQYHYLISLGLITLILIVFLMKSKKDQPKYYSSFWVESIPILWFGILSVFQYYFDISW